MKHINRINKKQMCEILIFLLNKEKNLKKSYSPYDIYEGNLYWDYLVYFDHSMVDSVDPLIVLVLINSCVLNFQHETQVPQLGPLLTVFPLE